MFGVSDEDVIGESGNIGVEMGGECCGGAADPIRKKGQQKPASC